MKAAPVAIVVLMISSVCISEDAPSAKFKGLWYINSYIPAEGNDDVYTCFKVTYKPLSDTLVETELNYKLNGEYKTGAYNFTVERVCDNDKHKYIVITYHDYPNGYLCSFFVELSDQDSEYDKTLCDPRDFGPKDVCLSKSATPTSEIAERCTEEKNYKQIDNSDCED